jgi:hypothetical protein
LITGGQQPRRRRPIDMINTINTINTINNTSSGSFQGDLRKSTGRGGGLDLNWRTEFNQLYEKGLSRRLNKEGIKKWVLKEKIFAG